MGRIPAERAGPVGKGAVSEAPYVGHADDATRRAYVAQHVSADLIYVWEEMGLSLLRQRELAERYRSVALFSSIADTRADARAALTAGGDRG